MPIEVTCPSCQATLPIPENFTGKKVRCSDCQGIVDVPGTRAPAIAKAVVAKAIRKPDVVDEKRPSRRRRDADDEEEDAPRRKPKRVRDDDDDDDRPRRGSKPGFPMVWLAVIAGVIGIVGLSAGAWFLTSGPHVEPPRAPVPNAVVPGANPPAANGPLNNFAPINGQQNDVPQDGWEHEVVPNQPKK